MALGFGNITDDSYSRGSVVGSTNNVAFYMSWESSSGVDILVEGYLQWGLQSGSVTDNENSFGGPDDNTSYSRSQNQALDTDQLYKYRVVTVNVDTGQTRTGTTYNFKTYPQAPTCPTPSASSITGTTATISATGYALNVTTSTGTAYLEYKKASEGSWTTATSSTATSGNLSANLTGLSMGTLYDVRVLIDRTTENATSVAGTTYQFTTLSPSATTSAASGVSSSGATLNGTYDCQGAVIGDPVTVKFEWGPTVSYGNTVTITSTASGTGSVSTNTTLSGLTASTLYYFRLVALTSTVTTNGSQLSFTTLSGQDVAIIF